MRQQTAAMWTRLHCPTPNPKLSSTLHPLPFLSAACFKWQDDAMPDLEEVGHSSQELPPVALRLSNNTYPTPTDRIEAAGFVRAPPPPPRGPFCIPSAPCTPSGCTKCIGGAKDEESHLP